MIEFLKQYGPALLVLLISFYRDQTIKAKNELRVSDLEKKILENHAKVDADNANVSDADGIAKIAGPRD